MSETAAQTPPDRAEKPCLVCGRVEDKPMCYRGEPWCCNRHRKQVQAMTLDELVTAQGAFWKR
jgi:hypothetical protein